MKRLVISVTLLLTSLALLSNLPELISKGWEREERNQICSLSFSPDGKTLLLGTRGVARLMCASSGKVLKEVSSGAGSWAYAHWNPNGKGFFVMGEGGTYHASIQFFDAQGEALTEPTEAGGLRDFEFSPDGKVLALATAWKGNYRLRLYDQSGKELRYLDFPSYLNGVSFSPNGKKLAVGGTWPMEFGVEIYDVKNLKPQARLLPDVDVQELVWLDKNRIAVSELGSRRGTKIWDARKESEPLTDYFSGNRVAVTANRKHLLITNGQPARTWDVKGSKVVASNWDASNAYQCNLASKGRRAVARWIGKDKLVVWDIRSGKTLLSSKHPGLEVAKLSPDGRQLAFSARVSNRSTLRVGPLKKK